MTDSISTAHHRAAILVQHHGEPDAQKNNLVAIILAAFHDPSKWPMTDAERIDLLKSLYHAASAIRKTEEALKYL